MNYFYFYLIGVAIVFILILSWVVFKKEPIDKTGFTIKCIGSWLTIGFALWSAWVFHRWMKWERDNKQDAT